MSSLSSSPLSRSSRRLGSESNSPTPSTPATRNPAPRRHPRPSQSLQSSHPRVRARLARHRARLYISTQTRVQLVRRRRFSASSRLARSRAPRRQRSTPYVIIPRVVSLGSAAADDDDDDDRRRRAASDAAASRTTRRCDVHDAASARDATSDDDDGCGGIECDATAPRAARNDAARARESGILSDGRLMKAESANAAL